MNSEISPEDVALSEHGLAPLRRIATIQAWIQERLQSLLARGVVRCSEAMMREFDLVYDSALPQLMQELTSEACERLSEDLRYWPPIWSRTISHAWKMDASPWALWSCSNPTSPTFPRRAHPIPTLPRR